MKSIRLKQMEQYIQENGFVSVAQLCKQFGIHPNTARADIKALVESGIVKKEYGGVSKVSKRPTNYEDRKATNIDSKNKIARIAATLLEENDVIYIDGGTTAERLFEAAENLPENLTVITNSVEIIRWVSLHTSYTLFVLPGQLDRQMNSICSLETIDSIKAYKIGKAFIGIRAISDRGELLSSSGLDARMKKTVVETCGKTILMADHHKTERQNALYSFSTLDKVNYWICDSENDMVLKLCKEHNVILKTK